MSDSPCFPNVFSVMSWNLFKWKGVTVHDWPDERETGIQKTVRSLKPDIICTQETSPEYLDAILGENSEYKCILPSDDVMKSCAHVTDPIRPSPYLSKHLRYRRANVDDNKESFTGWLDEGNIVFRSDKFHYVSHGIVDVGIEAAEARNPKRRLFYLRLKPKISPASSSILVTTAHLTWEGGSVQEQAFPFPSERCVQACRIITALQELRLRDEPVIFCGDMNDSWHVPFKMREAGFSSYDMILNLPTEITHPARPCFHEERIPSQTRDWIFSSKELVPVLGRVCSNMVLGLSRHPSDHFPVLCLYEVPIH